MLERKLRKTIEWAFYNYKAMRDEAAQAIADALDARIEEVEDLLRKMHFGRVTRKEWARIQELVAERQMQRYITCLNSGMDEHTAAGAFDD